MSLLEHDQLKDLSEWKSWISNCLLGLMFEYKQRDGTEIHPYVCSAFVVEVADQWILVTAGHVKEIFEHAERGDIEILGVRLLDGFGSEPKTTEGFDFDTESVVSAFYYDETAGLDVAFIHLRPFYRNLIAANGITVFTEANWESSEGQEFEAYLLLGLLEETVRAEGSKWTVGTIITSIKKADSPAPCLVKEVDRFYGVIARSDEYKSIKGMSGGPLLGFKRDSKGSVRYWIVGLQSGWDSATRTIAVSWIATIRTAFHLWFAESFELDSGEVNHQSFGPLEAKAN